MIFFADKLNSALVGGSDLISSQLPIASVLGEKLTLTDTPVKSGTAGSGCSALILKSNGFWVAGDVGKYVRFSSGENYTAAHDMYEIDTFVTANEVTLAAPGSAAIPSLGDTFSIYSYSYPNLQDYDIKKISACNIARNRIIVSNTGGTITNALYADGVVNIAKPGTEYTDGNTYDNVETTKFVSATASFSNADFGKMIRVGLLIHEEAADEDLSVSGFMTFVDVAHAIWDDIVIGHTLYVRYDAGGGSFVNVYRKIISSTELGGNTTVGYAGAVIPDLTVTEWAIYEYLIRRIDRVIDTTTIILSSAITWIDTAGTTPNRRYPFAVCTDNFKLIESVAIYSATHRTIAYDGAHVGGLLVPAIFYKPEIVLGITDNWRVLVDYRALKTTVEIESVATSAEVTSMVGADSQYNPLGYAGQIAMGIVSDSEPIYLVGVNLWEGVSSNLGHPETMAITAGYTAARDLLGQELVYSVVPLTQDSGIVSLFNTHATDMSTPEVGMWRRVVFSPKMSFGEYDSDTGYINSGQDGSNKSIQDDSASFVSSVSVSQDDTVVITSPTVFIGEYLVESVTETALELQGSDWSFTKEFETTDGLIDLGANEARVYAAESTLWQLVEVGDVAAITVAGGSAEYRDITVINSSINFEYDGSVITAGVLYLPESTGSSKVQISIATESGDGAHDGDCVYVESGPNIGSIAKLTWLGGAGVHDYTLSVAFANNSVISDVYKLFPPVVISIIRRITGVEFYVNPYTKTQQAEAIKAVADGYSDNKRLTLIHPPSIKRSVGTDSNGNTVYATLPGYYACVSEAAQCQLFKPQETLTRSTFEGGFSEIVYSNKTFNNTQLNIIASGGVTILTQDGQASPIVYRHHLTTNMSSITLQEVCILKDVDYMSKALKSALDSEIGNKKTITNDYLTALGFKVQAIFANFEANGYIVTLNGSPAFQTITLAPHATLPDRVYLVMQITIPYPPNYIELPLLI